MYKSLLVLEHLVKNGPYRICTELVNPDNMEIIENLRDSFDYIDARGRDHGLNVRHRAKELLALVQDKERLDMEREKASKLRSVATDAATSDGSFGWVQHANSLSGAT